MTGVPVAFVWAILRGGFARTIELQELAAWLGAEDNAQPSLQSARADALGDPTLVLAFWIEPTGTYVDAAGREPQMPAVGDDRAAVEISVGTERVGAILCDASLIHEPGHVRAAGSIVAPVGTAKVCSPPVEANEHVTVKPA